jgi:hypothetical protein
MKFDLSVVINIVGAIVVSIVIPLIKAGTIKVPKNIKDAVGAIPDEILVASAKAAEETILDPVKRKEFVVKQITDYINRQTKLEMKPSQVNYLAEHALQLFKGRK